MPTPVSAVQQAYRDARQRRDSLESTRASEEHELTLEYTATLRAHLQQKYGEQIRIAREEEARTHAAWMQEKEQEALTRQYPYPLGTVMVQWENPRYSHRDDPRLRRLTGKRGVLEIITATSEHPANRSYGLAGIGDLVIRVLKKDGTPGKNYVGSYWRMRYQWVPEGTDLTQADLSWPEVGAEEQSDGRNTNTEVES